MVETYSFIYKILFLETSKKIRYKTVSSKGKNKFSYFHITRDGWVSFFEKLTLISLSTFVFERYLFFTTTRKKKKNSVAQ
jgi:hypothetical protein